LQNWQILTFPMLPAISNSYQMPTLNELVPERVTRNAIQSAIAIDRAVFHGSRVVGPALAGIFISAWGAASAFFCNAISFVAMIIALFTIPPRSRGTAEEESKRASGIKDGFRYVAKDKPSLAMIGLIAATTVFIFPIITVMMPLYVRLVLGLGADRLGYLMGASAVGSVIGAIFLITLPRQKRPQPNRPRRHQSPLLFSVIAFSTCWNSGRHTDGEAMLREIKTEFGFDFIELGHGIRLSLVPGIQKMFEVGEVRFSSLHNFCPLPVEVMVASPNCYRFSVPSAEERERAVKQTFQTMDFAARLDAPVV